MATSAPGHAAVTDVQGRLTMTMIDDVTQVTTSTGTTTPLTFVSRLMSADASPDTKITEVVEIGTNGIVGGVADLGIYKGKFSRYDTSSKLLGLVTGKHLTGSSTSWTYYDLANANFDYVRLVADPTGNVFAASVGMSAILTGAAFSQKTSGIATEEYDFQGPQLATINGFPVAKVYSVLSADVTAGYFSIAGTLGTGESPNPVIPPASGQPPSSLYDSGRRSFLKVTRVPVANSVINGVNYAAGSRVRYRENQPYDVVAAGLSTAGSQTVTPAILLADGATQNYMGPELVVGANIIVDIGGANQETCAITAATSSTITFTTTKTHSGTGIGLGLVPTTGYCLYNPLNHVFVFGDTLAIGDVIRVLFASYATTSTPTTIGTSSLDNTDVPGVPGRVVPVSIAAYGIPRCSSSDIKVTIARKEVQGLGENEVVWGTAGVPKIDYSLDVISTDNLLTQTLQTGSQVAGAGGDIFSADYQARYMLANASPMTVTIKNPNNNTKTIKQYAGNLPVFGSTSESGTSTGEMTLKLSGMDYSGQLTITAYS